MKTVLVIAGILLCLSGFSAAWADGGGGDDSDDPKDLLPQSFHSQVPDLPYEEPDADRAQREGKSRDVFPESGTIIQNDNGTQQFCFSDGSGDNFCHNQ